MWSGVTCQWNHDWSIHFIVLEWSILIAMKILYSDSKSEGMAWVPSHLQESTDGALYQFTEEDIDWLNSKSWAAKSPFSLWTPSYYFGSFRPCKNVLAKKPVNQEQVSSQIVSLFISNRTICHSSTAFLKMQKHKHMDDGVNESVRYVCVFPFCDEKHITAKYFFT